MTTVDREEARNALLAEHACNDSTRSISGTTDLRCPGIMRVLD